MISSKIATKCSIKTLPHLRTVTNLWLVK